MLTSRTEKELSGEFERYRVLALEDASQFESSGEYGLTDLGVGVEGEGINDPDTYQLDTTPIDPNTAIKTNKVDIRFLPGHD